MYSVKFYNEHGEVIGQYTFRAKQLAFVKQFEDRLMIFKAGKPIFRKDIYGRSEGQTQDN